MACFSLRWKRFVSEVGISAGFIATFVHFRLCARTWEEREVASKAQRDGEGKVAESAECWTVSARFAVHLRSQCRGDGVRLALVFD